MSKVTTPGKLKVKAVLNRMVMRDDNGQLKTGARPFQFRIYIGKLILTGVWLDNTDERSKEYFDQVVGAITDLQSIETEIVG